MASSSAYEDVRAAIAEKGSDARVEVNQRALIDKILARYASTGAVYRELLQNSNDAEATIAEIIITTSSSAPNSSSNGGESNGSGKYLKEEVTQVIYRNNGHPFRAQDWARLRKIAEGNPDESKVGAFGVGAYTMFSICEEPLVVSGKRGEEEAMFFFWKGDALWTKTGMAPKGILNMSTSLQNEKDVNNWTSFILPSRDPYPLPDLVEFGQFLTASLTFTQCLSNIRVYVNQTLQMNIQKTILESRVIATPKASSWWKNDGAVTYSSSGMFTLGKAEQLTQTSVLMGVSLRKNLSPTSEMETSVVKARYASALVKTKIPQDIEKRMIRVTKKNPPKELTVQIFLDAADSHDQDDSSKPKTDSKVLSAVKKNRQSRAVQITDSFAPTAGSGRIFIGFRTSQTTGLGIHLAAPLMPTVEREAIDFVDPALRVFNMELLEVAGILMRLALEHEMGRLGIMWDEGKEERDKWKAKQEEQQKLNKSLKTTGVEGARNNDQSKPGNQSASDNDSTTIQSSLFSFASFMARGVKNTLVEAIKAVPVFCEDDETTELLNPTDERPLSLEERDAVILMRAYCPRVSTPDSLVGQCLAKGFGRCLSSLSPPVLTMSGVVRGVDARLCHHGMEAFRIPNVVRRVMLENAREYHTVIATCPILSMHDMIETMKSQVLSEQELIRLLKWWPKICRMDQSFGRYGSALKEVIRFESSLIGGQETVAKNITRATADPRSIQVINLDSILYYTSNKLLQELPLPDTAITRVLQNAVGLRNLEDKSFSQWFVPLPFDMWASFISSHPCLTEAKFSDDKLRIQVLAALSKHYDELGSATGKRRFINLLPVKTLFLPIEIDDGMDTPQCRNPSDIYLSSSDLSAFEGLGKFEKVSVELSKEGVSDDFLLALGVRKTISMDFLFLHLDTLQWNSNPKSLICYLMNAELSQEDFHKLRCTKYLPAKDDQVALYSPIELYLPNEELKMFPFVRFLQWPEVESMTTVQRSFLINKLGMRVDPPLSGIMTYLQAESAKTNASRDEASFVLALRYLAQKLGPKGIYEKEYEQYRGVKFLPCIRQNLETGEVVRERQSPSACFYNPSALIMGFSVLDPDLDTVTIATRTKCLKDPPATLLLKRLIQLVHISQNKLSNLEQKKARKDEKDSLTTTILTLFEGVFLYLSSRTSEFDKSSVAVLAKTAFIPCKSREQVVFCLPSQVFFKGDGTDSLAESLFKEVEYNTFLSLAGVKAEPTVHELFDLMIQKPDEVLDTLGEAKYKTLLRRIASDPPFKQVTKEIRECAFLLGYLVMDEEISDDNDGVNIQKAQYVLARADDIYIVDNSFLRRQFSMLVSPMEQQLEDFYHLVGSRISERRPLVLSPFVSSRPLVPNAVKLLSDDYLEIIEVDDHSIHAKYMFDRSSKSIPTTCCAKSTSSRKTLIFITPSFDWFDVGTAIGSLILKRCQLEDAFFLSSILEASLDTLRHRGFPVDRVLRPVVVEPPPPPPPDPKPNTEYGGASHNSSLDQIQGDSPPNKSVQPSTGGFDSILSEMFPNCPLDVVQGMLGENPSKEKAREVANQLASFTPSGGRNTKNSTTMNESKTHPEAAKDSSISSSNGLKHGVKQAITTAPKKKSSASIMGRMLGGLRPGSAGGDAASSVSRRVVHQHSSVSKDNQKVSSSPVSDATSQQSLEAMLQESIQSSRSVQSAGVSAPETLLKTLPDGLECGSEGCEVIPQQNIHPFRGPLGTHTAKNGIRIFSASNSSSSYLSNNFDSVDQFSIVLQNLTVVYKVPLATVAIYYDPSGNTIAFNSNKALYFNLRFFVSLHRSHVNSACYAYWYTVFAHELAHNLVTAHNKEHGKFTESIIALYLPKFVDLLTQLAK
eukprot:CCRYP_014180-RC/>CCRYP_014180-RC protein AED:0.05 eAED:0.05 QI:56/1/1/1/0.9/0.81/11/470/1857